jgi:hypothetical protein
MDEKAAEIHKIDSMNQLIYTLLMMAALLTVYAFKLYPVKYVHESGLALLYGILVGAMIKYIGDAHTSYTYLRVIPDDSLPDQVSSPEVTAITPLSVSHTLFEVPGLGKEMDWDMPPDSLWIPLQVQDKEKNHTTRRTYVYAFKGKLKDRSNQNKS